MKASRGELGWRLLCFLCCAQSGIALMAKAYGWMEMRRFVLLACLPAMVVLGIAAFVTRKRHPRIDTDLAIGAVAGLAGTVAYDLVRIPAVIVGYRLYGAVSVFGLWLLDAAESSPFTETAGWSYNYFNGICFGMMYALWMRGRRWGFGVLWAFALETLAVVTPFGRIFGLRGNAPVLAMAYAAHVAYGVPLGRAVENWQDTRLALSEMPRSARVITALAALLWLVHPLLSPGAWSAHHRAVPGQLRVEGTALDPDWLRVPRGRSVVVVNPEDRPVTVVLQESRSRYELAAGASFVTPPLAPGIHQLFVDTPLRTHSSFILVEPVEQAR